MTIDRKWLNATALNIQCIYYTSLQLMNAGLIRGIERKLNNGDLQKHKEELMEAPSLIKLKICESWSL